MDSLTAKQQAVLEHIRHHREQHGMAPTIREIQQHFGHASPFAASRHLAALEKKGFLNRAPRRARALRLVGERRPTSFRRIPLLGTIPAGLPREAVEQTDRCVSVACEDLDIPRNARTFALRVQGDSMRDAAILDGDVVIMEFAEARHGDIVAALIDGETTLKRFLLQRGRPYLRAENKNYPDLIPARELVIQGVLRQVIRNIPRRI